jgi:hypothetical protein
MATPEELNGTEIVVLINGVVLGTQRGCTFSETNEEIDFSSKDSRYMKRGYGRYQSNFDLETLYIPNASGIMSLKNAARDATHLTVIRQEEGASVESCDAIITAFDTDAPDQDATVISVSFGVNGVWASGA